MNQLTEVRICKRCNNQKEYTVKTIRARLRRKLREWIEKKQSNEDSNQH